MSGTFKPGDVVVVLTGSISGTYPHLAVIASDDGARCLIEYRKDGADRTRGELKENMRLATDEEKKTLDGLQSLGGSA
jgi:hypothetical protein